MIYRTIHTGRLTVLLTFVLALTLRAGPAAAQQGAVTLFDGTATLSGGGVISTPLDVTNPGGTFTTADGTLVLNGGADQTLAAGPSDVYFNLTVDKPGSALVLGAPVAVAGLLDLRNGTLDLGSHPHDLGTTGRLATAPGAGVVGPGGGVLTATRMLDSPQSVDVAGLGAVITSPHPLGLTTVTRGHVAQTGEGSTSVRRYYDIIPEHNTGLDATLVFHYDEAELEGLAEDELALFRSGDDGATWMLRGGTADPDADAVTLAGLDAFSRWTAGSLFAPFAFPPLDHPHLLLSDTRLDLDGPAQAVGDLHANDDIRLKKGAPSTYEGHVTAAGHVKIDKDNTVEGNVLAGGKLDLAGNAAVTGTAEAKAAVAPVTLAGLSFEAGGHDVKVKMGQSQALRPGSYGKIRLEKEARLELSSGAYFFETLDLEKEARLSLDVRGGLIDVHVVGTLVLEKEAAVEITPVGERGSRWVRFLSLGDVDLMKEAVVFGTIHAPSGKVKLDADAYLRGAVFAHEVDVSKNAVLLHHSAPVPDASAVETVAASAESAAEAVELAAETLPMAYGLSPGYPNPFNPQTTFTLAVREAQQVEVSVYNLLGRRVAVLHDGSLAANQAHQLVFEAGHLASGPYVIRAAGETFAITRQVMLLK